MIDRADETRHEAEVFEDSRFPPQVVDPEISTGYASPENERTWHHLMAQKEALSLPRVQPGADGRSVDAQSMGDLSGREPGVETTEPQDLILGEFTKDSEIERVH